MKKHTPHLTHAAQTGGQSNAMLSLSTDSQVYSLSCENNAEETQGQGDPQEVPSAHAHKARSGSGFGGPRGCSWPSAPQHEWPQGSPPAIASLPVVFPFRKMLGRETKRRKGEKQHPGPQLLLGLLDHAPAEVCHFRVLDLLLVQLILCPEEQFQQLG